MTGSGWTAAYVLSLIGGVFILLGAAGILAVGGEVSTPFGWPDYSYLVCGFLGLILGILAIIGAALAFQRPANGVAWGSLIMTISIVSWIVALGGMIVGSILAFVGGLLFILVKPEGKIPVYGVMKPSIYPPPQSPLFEGARQLESSTIQHQELSVLQQKQETQAIPPPVIDDGRCRQCGQEVESDLNYCPHCGFRAR